MKGRCESNCGGDEVYPATFRNEEETGLKLNDDDEVSYFTDHKVHFKSFFFQKLIMPLVSVAPNVWIR